MPRKKPVPPALAEEIMRLNLAAVPHGQKTRIVRELALTTGCSKSTVYRALSEVMVRPVRKRRSDAGAHALSLADANRLSEHIMEGFRANNKRIISTRLALKQLRADNPAFACVVDAETGELVPISDGACIRALRKEGLHPDQLRQPEAVQALASEHPNHVWQIDASISTLFYVPDETQSGLQDMPPGEFYKNKPGNFERIKRQRLTRFCITDHCSGSIFVHYVAGGESMVNMAESFLLAVSERPGMQAYGVPFHLMMDPGAAGLGGAFKNLLRYLSVKPIENKAGNARAKGQVENAHNLVETDFESGFKLTHVPSIAWINEQAQRWMRYFNSVNTHSRHGMARWTKWMEITPAQLRLVDAAQARKLLVHKPSSPKVSPELTVQFAGRVWDVRDVPGRLVGETLDITFNPFDAATAYVVQRDADGMECFVTVHEVQLGAHGFRADAAVIGQEFKSPPQTQAVANRRAQERRVTGTDTDEAAAAARKAKALPFGGTFDPYKRLDDLPAATPLPRRGTPLLPQVNLPSDEPVVLTHFQAASELVRRGLQMTPERNAQVASWYPQGVPEAELDELQRRLTVRATLRVVGGGDTP